MAISPLNATRLGDTKDTRVIAAEMSERKSGHIFLEREGNLPAAVAVSGPLAAGVTGDTLHFDLQ